MITAGVVRTLLIADIVGIALLALFYLRQRRMHFASYCFWGTLAIIIPVIGPFLLISLRPGVWDPSASVFNDIRRFFQFLRGLLADLNLLPDTPPGKKLSRMDQARLRRKKRQEKQG